MAAGSRSKPTSPENPFFLCRSDGARRIRTNCGVGSRGSSDAEQLNLSRGPLLRLVLFKVGRKRPNRLLIVIHHLVVDGISWRILLEDIQRMYEQARRGEPIHLPAKTTSFKAWSERLAAYPDSEALESERTYWFETTAQSSDSSTRQRRIGNEKRRLTRSVSASLSEEETNALLKKYRDLSNSN